MQLGVEPLPGQVAQQLVQGRVHQEGRWRARGMLLPKLGLELTTVHKLPQWLVEL